MLALHVTDVERVTPHVVRIGFTGPGLDDFPTWPDQQLKLLFPKPGHDLPRLSYTEDEHGMGWYRAFTAVPEHRRPWMRSYTVRCHDPRRQRIAVDFVLHGEDAGPATRWAASARPGDTIGRYGPAAAYARPLPAADWYLFAGDETALPAIATLVASLPPSTPAKAVIEVRDEAEQQSLATRARLSVRWVHRGDTPPGRGGALLRAVRDTDFPPGEVHARVAGEAGAVRAIRRHLVEERGVPKRAVDFSGYWRLRLTQDDAPTEDDLAEARERLSAAEEEAAVDAAAVKAFDEAYTSGHAPWVVDGPQPAIAELVERGLVRGRVLDVGCGTGEHTIHLASLGYDVLGVDLSPEAVERARANAARRGVAARFEVADVLRLAGRYDGRYDTVLDSAVFHVFDAAGRVRYARALRGLCAPGALVHVLALSDTGPAYGPRVGAQAIRDAFTDGWEVESVRESVFRGVLDADGGTGELPAWLARVRAV